MSLLEVKQLSKNYGNNGPDVLQKIDLSVDEGEFVAIMGPSGSGKTTLLNCIGTLDKGSSGTILLNGAEPAHYSKEKLAEFRRQNLGFIFQSYNLLAPLSVEENILLPLTLDRKNLKESQIKAEKIMDLLGISSLKNKRIHEISGGQAQRVAIGRALIHSPKLILADEPTGNLDSKAAGDVMNILQEMNKKEKVTTLMVTHDPNSASYSSRVIFIKDGKLFNEIYCGESRDAFYQEILTVLSFLGGNHRGLSHSHLA